jgi:GR25 family glycosyltransferase involved in LPS biosynthesis
MKKFCINLDHRTNRWDLFKRRCPQAIGHVERFSGVDAVTNLLRNQPPASWMLGAGAWGCYQSHLQLLEMCVAEDIDEVMIFEDDAQPAPDFKTRFDIFMDALPTDWDMFYLGGQLLDHNLHPPQKVNEQIYQAHNVNRLHAYAIRQPFMYDVIEHIRRHQEFSDKHQVDHRIGELHHDARVYIPRRWFFGQSAGKSDISIYFQSSRFWDWEIAVPLDADA